MIRTLEREAEIERLAAALTSAAGGEGRLVFIEGPPGIGKTQLIEEVRALAKAQGFARLKAVGDEPEQSLPWGVVRQLVERSALRYSGETRQAILAGPAGSALHALDEVPEPGADELALARTLHRLWWVAADLCADRPLLITVDDLQWADLPSQRFVAYLARRLDDLPIALVVGSRPVTTTEGPLAELAAARGGVRLRPAPLTREGIGALVGNGGAPAADRVIRALHDATGGNPFLAEQLAEELRHRELALDDPQVAAEIGTLGPASVSRVVLTRCGEDARELAAAAATLGTRSSPALAADLAALPAERVGPAADELREQLVLTPEPVELVFAHPVIRESVLAALAPARRAELHAAAARALTAVGAPADRIALHLVEAPLDTIDGGLELLRRAGVRALGDGDAATAVRLLTRVVDEHPGDAELEATLGRALLLSGRPAEARPALLTAAARLDPGRPRALAVATAAEATAILEGPAAAVAELRSAREGWDGAAAGATLLDARLAMLGSYRLGAWRGWSEHLSPFAGLTGETADERTLLAGVTQRALNEARPATEVRELALRALRSGALLDDLSDGLLPWGLASFALICADGIEEAEAELARAQARIRAGGSPAEFTVVAIAAAQIAWRQGDMRTCENEAVGGIDAAILMEPGPLRDAMRAVATRMAVVAQMEQAELARAAETLRSFDERPLDAESTVPVERVRFARSYLALASGDANRALAEARALQEAEERAGARNPGSPWWPPAAYALLRLGRDDEARAVAEEWLSVARGFGAATDIGAGLRLLARADPEHRLALLEEAVATLEHATDRLEYGAALVDYGEVLGNLGRRTEAREPLNRGLELAEACVARSLSSRAVEALATLGDRPRRFVRSGVDELTASERRVARLAAEGHTNREIAQELFVTPKTVENHLRHTYAKLGVAGRRELAGVLAVAA